MASIPATILYEGGGTGYVYKNGYFIQTTYAIDTFDGLLYIRKAVD
jgi:hypothetical protein